MIQIPGVKFRNLQVTDCILKKASDQEAGDDMVLRLAGKYSIEQRCEHTLYTHTDRLLFKERYGDSIQF